MAASSRESDKNQEDRQVLPLDRKLKETRKELLETSVRSRLLHTPLGSSRAKIIEIRDELAEQVFRILVHEGRSMSFLPSPDDREGDQQGQPDFLRQPDEEEIDIDGLAHHHTDTKLQTNLSSVKLQGWLRSIAYDAQTIENEQGVNILYIAIGFLKWYEAHDRDKPRYAPLVLVPVSLTRSSASERFKVAYSGEEISTNLSLQQRLKDEGVKLPDLPDPEDLSPAGYVSDVAQSVTGMQGWEVLPNTIALGFFSFAKLMMYRDLDSDLWPVKGGLRDHPIIRGLLGEGFRGDREPLLPDDKAVDTLIDIGAAAHVVDADSSQMLAIEEVRRGRNLVIQGPPGTGKSQTITNLIASAVREGKAVLFVAEKMAALNVVRANLERVGLGQMCLELHSHKSKKKTVLEDLERTYQITGSGQQLDAGLANKLREARDSLNKHVRQIHEPIEPSTKTPFEIFSKLARLAGRGVPSPDFQLLDAREWTTPDIDERAMRVERLAAHIANMGVPAHHPWKGVGLDVVLPQDVERVANRAQDRHSALAKLIDRAAKLGARASTPSSTIAEAHRLVQMGEVLGQAPDIDLVAIGDQIWSNRRADVTELVGQGNTYASARRRLNPIVVPEAWDEDVSDIRHALTHLGRSWVRWLRADYRHAKKRFRRLIGGTAPKRLGHRLEILLILETGQRARQRVIALNAVGASAFGRKWAAAESDWSLLQDVETWEQNARAINLPQGWKQKAPEIADLAAFISDTRSFSQDLDAEITEIQRLWNDLSYNLGEGFQATDLESIPLLALGDRLAAFASEPERVHQWCTWRILSREAKERGLDHLIHRLEDGRVPAETAVDVFQYACHETLARQVFATHRDLAVFDGRSHERVLADFQRLDRERLKLARCEVAAQHLQAMPRGDREIGEIGILIREWRKQRRHLPLRQLIKAAGRAMQRIKPVWMMSPMSLAQFVEPGSILFDLVLMDEASQIRPVEALGSVARGRQLVVVGDDKQLPPTSFFERVAADDLEPADAEDFQVADVESILGLCGAQGIPPRMLTWHYRSQHESLIAVSNLEFYKRLFIVPSAHSEDLGLRFRKVNGVYDRGRTATNRLEASVVARAVLDHARRYGRSERFPHGMSLGVGTFSVAQRDAILDELEVLWRQNPEFASFFDAASQEPFFVKNLEAIQGDERDVVFISVGYGPDPDGFVSMAFPTLVTQGGERRLNVLISRARRRCEVFSSITAADIDLSRTQSVGVRVLKTFLQFAETGQLERATIGQRPIDSDFEADVGMALAAVGYLVEHQVGVAGFFVDLAIRDPERPGRYVLGIECDGATYHSSRAARDRDRLREQVLRDRGWQIHRIWSVDWYRKRHEELQRTVAAIEMARSAMPSDTQPVQVAETPRSPAHSPENPRIEAEVPIIAHVAPYIEADFREEVQVEPHELPLVRRIPILVRIVEVEGPVHEEEIGRRYATVCGKDRAGNRIQEATKNALSIAVRKGQLCRDGSFYSIRPLHQCPPRDRSATASLTLRKPEMLPPIEIRTGLRRIVEDHLGVEPQTAILEVARMFGFQRTGNELQRVIEEHLRTMQRKGIFLVRNGNRLYISDSFIA
jgi:very-short-patch-repair endonuclease